MLKSVGPQQKVAFDHVFHAAAPRSDNCLVCFVCFELVWHVIQGIDDEVKVHVSEDIEEGEVTSDEEGEIKGG